MSESRLYTFPALLWVLLHPLQQRAASPHVATVVVSPECVRPLVLPLPHQPPFRQMNLKDDRS